MGRDDLFRRSFEAGTAFFDMTRERAEALVKELVKAGEVQKGKAQKAIDEVVERSRKGAEELRQLIRREIADQIDAMGLATRADVERLESRLAASAPTVPTAPATSASPPPPPAPAPTKAPPVKRAGIKKAGAKGAGAVTKAGAAKEAGAAGKAAGAATKADVAGNAGGTRKARAGKAAVTLPAAAPATAAASTAPAPPATHGDDGQPPATKG